MNPHAPRTTRRSGAFSVVGLFLVVPVLVAAALILLEQSGATNLGLNPISNVGRWPEL